MKTSVFFSLVSWFSTTSNDNSDLGKYSLPWKKLKQEEHNSINVPNLIFERVNTFDNCKRRVGDFVVNELGDKSIEELVDIELRELQIDTSYELTKCHFEEHGRKLYASTPADMSEDEFAIYTQFVLAIEDTIVNRILHERWQKSVEILVTETTRQLEFVGYKLNSFSDDMKALSESQNKTLEMQVTTLETANKTLEIQAVAVKNTNKTLELQNRTLRSQNESLKLQNASLLKTNETLILQSETIKNQEKIRVDTEKHFENIQKGTDKIGKLVDDLEMFSLNQERLLKAQERTNKKMTETAQASENIATMLAEQQEAILESQRQTEELFSIWKPMLNKLDQISRPWFWDLCHRSFYFFIWAMFLRLSHANNFSWLTYIAAIGIDISTDIDNMDLVRHGMVVFSLFCFSFTYIRFKPNRNNYTLANALSDIDKGIVPKKVKMTQDIKNLLMQAPPGYYISNDGSLAANT